MAASGITAKAADRIDDDGHGVPETLEGGEHPSDTPAATEADNGGDSSALSTTAETVPNPVLEALPPEVFLFVLSFLPVGDLLSATMVSRGWHALACDSSVWRPLYLRRFGDAARDGAHGLPWREADRLPWIDRFRWAASKHDEMPWEQYGVARKRTSRCTVCERRIPQGVGRARYFTRFGKAMWFHACCDIRERFYGRMPACTIFQPVDPIVISGEERQDILSWMLKGCDLAVAPPSIAW